MFNIRELIGIQGFARVGQDIAYHRCHSVNSARFERNDMQGKAQSSPRVDAEFEPVHYVGFVCFVYVIHALDPAIQFFEVR